MNKNLVYLVQTDTTVGFSSFDERKLNKIKNRSEVQKLLATVDSFKTLKNFVRVPKKYKKFIRNSKRTTFIYPNKRSFRCIDKKEDFYDFIKKFTCLYSTSANKNKMKFDKEFAFKVSDIIIEDKREFNENSSSKIIKVSKKKKLKYR